MTVIFPEVEKTKQLLSALKCRYWFAGGWAIDMFLGRQTRPHKDIEIAIARADQNHLLPLPDVQGIEYVENRERKPWHGQKLELPVHELVARFYGGAEVEILLNEFEGEDWIYRRNADTHYPLHRFSDEYLPPEVVLLYKSKNPRRQDEKDFAAAQGYLLPPARSWLRDSIARDDPKHPWITVLKKPGIKGATKGIF